MSRQNRILEEIDEAMRKSLLSKDRVWLGVWMDPEMGEIDIWLEAKAKNADDTPAGD